MSLRRCTKCSYSALTQTSFSKYEFASQCSCQSFFILKMSCSYVKQSHILYFSQLCFLSMEQTKLRTQRREISKTKSCLQLCHLHSLFRFSFTSRHWNCLPLHTLSQLSSSFAAGRKCRSRADKGQSTLWLSLTQGKVVCSVEKLGTKIWQTVLQFDQISL